MAAEKAIVLGLGASGEAAARLLRRERLAVTVVDAASPERVAARASELAREPAVWWQLGAAFSLMFTLVLAANLFADGVRDTFDPRLGGQR